MTWAAIKAELATIAAVSVTSPAAQTLHVYENPPETLQDLPCAVIFPPGRGVNRANAALQRRLYNVRIRVFVTDESLATAADLLDNFAEEFLDAFDAAVRANSTASLVVGPEVEAPAEFLYADRSLVGFDAILTVQDWRAATHSP